MLEHLKISLHALGIEHRVQRRVDFVLQREDVPADLALSELEHAGVEAAKSVGVVGGGRRASKRRLQSSGEVVAVEEVGGAIERRAARGRGDQ
jgi:hypothetical protein